MALASGPLTYTFMLQNQGPSDARNVDLIDMLPAGVTPSGPVMTNLGVLAAGSATSIVIAVTVDPGTLGMINNQAGVSSATSDPNPGDNMDSCATLVDAAFVVTNTFPGTGIVNVPVMALIQVFFDRPVNPVTVNTNNTFSVRGQQFGV